MPKRFPWGQIQGRINLPKDILEEARKSGTEAYIAAEEREFCDHQVEMLLAAPWMDEVSLLLPLSETFRLGFEPKVYSSGTDGPSFYFTYGVESHTDDQGPVLILVLANDGLKFWQGRQRHVTQPGEWFVFDDRRPHGVLSTKKSTSYVFCNLQLQEIRN